MQSARIDGQLGDLIPELNQRHAAIVAWERGATSEQIRAARLERMLGFKIDQWPLPDLDVVGRSSQHPRSQTPARRSNF